MQTCNNKAVNFSTLPAVLDYDQIKSASFVHELTYTKKSNIRNFKQVCNLKSKFEIADEQNIVESWKLIQLFYVPIE